MLCHTFRVAICVEEAIQEAERDGRFSNLPGRGQPLRLDPSPDAVVNNLLREAHARPQWINVACEIDALEERAARASEAYARRHAAELARLTAPPQKPRSESRNASRWRRFWRVLLQGSDNRLRRGDPLAAFNRAWSVEIARQAALLHEANAQIRRFNRLTPLRESQRNLIDVAAHLEAFATRFCQVAPTGEGGAAPLRATVPPHLLTSPEKRGETTPRDVRRQRILEAQR